MLSLLLGQWSCRASEALPEASALLLGNCLLQVSEQLLVVAGECAGEACFDSLRGATTSGLPHDCYSAGWVLGSVLAGAGVSGSSGSSATGWSGRGRL